MRSLAIAVLPVLGALVVLGTVAFAEPLPRAPAQRGVARALPHVHEPSSGSAPLVRATTTAPAPGFTRLPTLRFINQNTSQSADVRLYDAAGQVDELQAARLDGLLCDTRDPKHWEAVPLNRRTLQLVVRTALHFQVDAVVVVSAYRKPGRRREGPHASGNAVDFKLPGVQARVLASYLRTLPRVGVGIYTHPKTSFVHLDDREHSFHWLDASPPGRTWRERSLGGTGLAKLDAGYLRAGNWPEGTIAPSLSPL